MQWLLATYIIGTLCCHLVSTWSWNLILTENPYGLRNSDNPNSDTQIQKSEIFRYGDINTKLVKTQPKDVFELDLL